MANRFESQSNYNMQSSAGFQASQMPIKNKVKQIDNSVKDFTKSLNENKKEAQLLRSECATFEHHATENTNDILKEILEDVANLEKDFRKLQQLDVNEMNFLKQQQNQLQQEKMKLQQACVLLENRVANLEGDVGYEQ
eukprot:403376065